MALRGAVIKVKKSIKFKKQRHQQVSFEPELWGILAKTAWFIQSSTQWSEFSVETVDRGGGKKPSSKTLFFIFEQEASKLDTVGFPPDSIFVNCGPHCWDRTFTV